MQGGAFRTTARAAAATAPAALLAVAALAGVAVAVPLAAAWSVVGCRWALRGPALPDRLRTAWVTAAALAAAGVVAAVLWGEWAAVVALAAPQCVFVACTAPAADLPRRAAYGLLGLLPALVAGYAVAWTLVPLLYALGVDEGSVGMPFVVTAAVTAHLAGFALAGVAARREVAA